MGAQMFQFASKIYPKWKIISAKKQPKMSQSCVKVALHGKNCGLRKTRKLRNFALRNIAIFWGDYLFGPNGRPNRVFSISAMFILCNNTIVSYVHNDVSVLLYCVSVTGIGIQFVFGQMYCSVQT